MKKKFDGQIVGLALAMTVASAALVAQAPVAVDPTLALGSEGGDSEERRASGRWQQSSFLCLISCSFARGTSTFKHEGNPSNHRNHSQW